MGEYSKKLHIHKDGKIDDITLCTDTSDLPGTLPLRDGSTMVYADPGNNTLNRNNISVTIQKSLTTTYHLCYNTVRW